MLRRADGRRLRIEHGHGDRPRQAPCEGFHLAAPRLGTQPAEPVGHGTEGGDGGIVSIRLRDRGLPVRRPVEQPCERRVLRPPHLPPRDHAPVLRPREGDVEEPHGLGELLQPLDGRRPPVRREVDDLPVTLRRSAVIDRVHGIGPPARLPCVPREREEHHGKLESLGSVHGEDPDEPLVALDAQLRLLVPVVRIGPAAIEPGGELGRGEPVARLRRLQQLGEMPVVGEPSGTVGVPQEVLRAPLPFEQAQQHRSDAPRFPVRAPVLAPLRPGAPCLLVVSERVQRLRVETEQVAGERSSHPRLPTRIGERPQEAFELLRLARVEHAAVVDLDAAHPALA